MLYIVATPIGNLKDITLRALDVLKSVDVVACEDTRNTLKLLNAYEIKKPLIAYHKFNERASSEGIVKLLQEGKNVALVSDGGMPLISDPGYILVQRLKAEHIAYTVLPGANASLSALVLSGLNSERFSFVGFLPEQNTERKKLLNDIRCLKSTLLFHISPHSLKKDIDSIYSVLGERKACLVKEISKVFESTFDFVLGETLDIDERGEFVLVVEGEKESENDLNELSVEQHIEYYIGTGLSKNDAIKQVAKDRGVKKNDIYKLTINQS